MGRQHGVLPGVPYERHDLLNANAVFDLGEHKGSLAAHGAGVTLHDGKVGPDGCGQVGFIDDQQIGLSYARSAFARNFIAAGDIDHVNAQIGQLAAKMSGEVVAP